MDFHDAFKPVVMEHSKLEKIDNWYAALGVYVELLLAEVKEPKFS